MTFSMNSAGSIINKQFPVVRLSTFLEKSSLPPDTTLPKLVEYMTSTEKRPKWDTGFKEYKNLEATDKYSVLFSWMKKPIFFVSERDAIDKKVDFFYDNEFYSFSASVSDDYIPLNKDVTRITDYIFAYHIYQDETKFYIRSLSQIDFKMNVPQSLLNGTLPMKMKEWYKSMIAFMQKEYADENKLID